MAIIFLWATLLIHSFHVAAHLFDMIANQPNWKSGEINDVKSYRDFYKKSDPKYLFGPIHIGGTIFSLIALILVWNSYNPARIAAGISFLVAIGVFIWSVKVFIPINKYIFETQDYDPAKLKADVSKWIKNEYIRFILLCIGLASAICALNCYTGMCGSSCCH